MKEKELLDLLIESNEILRSCYQVAVRGGKETNWTALAVNIQNVLKKHPKVIYPSQPTPPQEGQDELWDEISDKFQSWIDNDFDERAASDVTEQELKSKFTIIKK